jgi:hypothetical protein
MGDWFSSDSEPQRDSGLEDMIADQRRETNRLAKERQQLEDEEGHQRRRNMRGTAALKAPKNRGPGFLFDRKFQQTRTT